MWGEIIYPFQNFNGATVEVVEWISNLIQHCIIHAGNKVNKMGHKPLDVQ